MVNGSLNTIFITIHENKYLANNDETTVLEANVAILPCNFGRRLYTLRVKGRPPDG